MFWGREMERSAKRRLAECGGPTRQFASAIIWVLVANALGCVTPPERAELESGAARFGTLLAMSSQGPKTPLQVGAGPRKLNVAVVWSNQVPNVVLLHFVVEPNRTYLLLAYETGHDLMSPTVAEMGEDDAPRPRSSQLTDAEAMGLAALGGGVYGLAPLVIMTAPIWGPPAYLAWAARSPKATSASDCCFVWIEDAESGVAVAGNPPFALASAIDVEYLNVVWWSDDSARGQGRTVVGRKGLVFVKQLPSGGEERYVVPYSDMKELVLIPSNNDTPLISIRRSNKTIEQLSVALSGAGSIDEPIRSMYELVKQRRAVDAAKTASGGL
jgi:hypothetical protein